MAPTFRHGKSAVILFNNANMGQILNEVTWSASNKPATVTTFGNSDEAYIPGLRDTKATLKGFWDASATTMSTAGAASSTKALDHKFANALAATTNPLLTVGVHGSSISYRALMGRVVATDYVATVPAHDVVSVSASMQCSGRQDYGQWLHSTLSSTASTAAFTSVDSGIAAGTTLGGVGHFHMVQDSTLTSLTVKIQHSSAASVWADLITFTATTATGSANSVQRSTVSGTVKRYVRANCTQLTGGAGKSVTYGVAFARRNLPTGP